MPSGGPRNSKPGTVHRNRADLTGDSTGGYGDGVNQQTIRTSTPDTRPAPSAPRTPPPGLMGPLTAPTRRPNEPVTAGLSRGAGPGPEALGQPQGWDQALWELRSLAARYPDNRDLLQLIALAESRQ